MSDGPKGLDPAYPITEAINLPDPLRADVRLLGGLLGQVLRESGTPGLYDDVERVRALTREAHAREDDDSLEAAVQVISEFSLERAEEIARAFTCYFHLVNVAEEYHRVRIYRQREAAAAPGDEDIEYLAAAYDQLIDEVGEPEAARRLAALEFRPVLTAHPTEARRRAVALSIRRISELIAEKDDPRTGGLALARLRRRLLAEIDVLWRTAPLRTAAPTPPDEVRTVMGIFDSTLFQVIPEVYRRLDDAIKRQDAGLKRPIVTPFVRVGSWIGADRDGNPNVTAPITREAARIQSEHLLHGLEFMADQVGRTLTLDATNTPVTLEFEALLEEQALLDPDLMLELMERSPNEPYRRALLIIAERIKAFREDRHPLAYDSAESCLRDLRIVQDSLEFAGDSRSAFGDLQKLIWQVQTFGFHLAELEVRQHSVLHRRTLENVASGEPLTPMSKEVLEVFRSIQAIQQHFGHSAAHRYIISFTKTAEDIENVYKLAEISLGYQADELGLDVIPLFETGDDLEASTSVLDEMLQIPQVQRRLEQTGRRVEIMLGYSDSSKDVGPVAATMTLYEAQERIAEWAQHNDITLTLFHGRGGALGRGGGPANQAVLAQPPGSVDGRFKLTEQGEVIFARYGDPVIAARHIEQVAAATLLASAPSTEERNSTAARDFSQMASTLEVASRERFVSLIDSDGFAKWFTQVTPQEEVGWLSLGSRPSRRGLSVESLEDLRAIPWVFAWSQARLNLAGWYGLGTALAAVGDESLLQNAYSRWPLFTSLIDNVEMSLAKTDVRIARRYLALGNRDDLAAQVIEEMELTKEWVLKCTASQSLLEKRPVLGRAIQVRSPYVDALSLLQLRALNGLRSAETTDAGLMFRDLMMLSVNGVSAGLQNTG